MVVSIMIYQSIGLSDGPSDPLFSPEITPENFAPTPTIYP
jgi:hypothetical protein